MTEVILPATTYSIYAIRPTVRRGSPASIVVQASKGRMLARPTFDQIPLDGTITSAVLRVFSTRAFAGNIALSVRPVTGPWTSSVIWSRQPAVGSPIAPGRTILNPPAFTAFDMDVTSWAISRNKNGLRIDTTAAAALYFYGSSSAVYKPVLIVNYVVIPDVPGSLVPDGGAVSVPSPILTYAGDDEMTAQKIEYSLDGTTPSFTTAWLPATSGYFDPATVSGAPVLAEGAKVYWRVTTDGPTGREQSVPSEWAEYTYKALPVVTITNPGVTSVDGSPPLQWEVGDQIAWKAEFTSGGQLVNSAGWQSDPDGRDWTPAKSIAVPGGQGRFRFWVQDSVIPRVAATGAPSMTEVIHDFTTTLEGAGVAINSLEYDYDEPVAVLHGTRTAGTPDQIGLFRDDGKGMVQVPLWDDAGVPGMWVPGVDFVSSGAFELRDYTASPRIEHTWQVRVMVDAAVANQGPTVTARPTTKGAWIVDPRTGRKVEILGYGTVPVIGQETSENSVLHVPVTGGLVVEPKRRRIIRTTRFGTIEGTVLNSDEETLLNWVQADSGLRYRLIFGKVNWSVILGDYSPTDTFYPDDCGPNRVLVQANWWQRLADY